MHKSQFANTGAIKKSVSAYKLIFKNMKKHRVIKASTNILIDIIEKEGKYDLNDEERLTLYKNTVKFILTYDTKKSEEGETLKVFSKLCKKCNVNIFEAKDKRNEGLEFRFVK